MCVEFESKEKSPAGLTAEERQQFDTHKQEYKAIEEQKKQDKDQDKRDPTMVAACFDLQQVRLMLL